METGEKQKKISMNEKDLGNLLNEKCPLLFEKLKNAVLLTALLIWLPILSITILGSVPSITTFGVCLNDEKCEPDASSFGDWIEKYVQIWTYGFECSFGSSSSLDCQFLNWITTLDHLHCLAASVLIRPFFVVIVNPVIESIRYVSTLFCYCLWMLVRLWLELTRILLNRSNVKLEPFYIERYDVCYASFWTKTNRRCENVNLRNAEDDWKNNKDLHFIT